MPQDLSEETMTQLSDALEKGRKIDAIKLYREATGLGLKDAKDAVEKLHADLHQKYPDTFPAPSKSAGCGSSAALLVLSLGLIYAVTQLPT